MDQATIDDVTAAVEGHTRAHRNLLAVILRILFGLWGWRGTRHDPILSNGAVAETILFMQDALDSARELEVAFVVEYAAMLGIDYDPSELDVDPVYVRDADFHDVYQRVLDEYRWQRYGRPRQWSESELEAAGYDSVDELLDDAYEFDRRVKRDLVTGREFEPVEESVGRRAAVVDVSTVPDESTAERWAREDAQDALDEAAWEAALERMETIVGDDLKRAADDSHQQMLDKKTIWLGYRRVIHPELSASGTCGLCVAAATRVYRKKTLAPMHSHCKCTTIGVSATSDVGRDINDGDVDEAWELLVREANGDETKLPFTREQLDAMREKGVGRSDYIFSGDENTPIEFGMEDLTRLYDEAGSTSAHDLREVSMDYGVNENGPTIEWVFRDGLDQAIRNRTEGRTFTPESLSVTRQKWARTREWAGHQYQTTLDAIEQLRGNPDAADLLESYERALQNFENVAARMGDNLRTYRL